MIEVVRERFIVASPERLWPVIDDVERLAEWFTPAERSELLEGEGEGRLQRIHGRWGRRRSQIDQRVTAYQPARLLEWHHEAERLDGKPAPAFASKTRMRIRLEPEGDGTRLRMECAQEPKSPVRGLLIRVAGSRELARHMERSLERLAAMHSRQPRDGDRVSGSFP